MKYKELLLHIEVLEKYLSENTYEYRLNSITIGENCVIALCTEMDSTGDVDQFVLIVSVNGERVDIRNSAGVDCLYGFQNEEMLSDDDISKRKSEYAELIVKFRNA